MSEFDKEINFQCWLKELKRTYGNKARTRRVKLKNPYIKIKYSQEVKSMIKYSKMLRKMYKDRITAFSSNNWYINNECGN